jgi:PhzF family phenazine biosynthesis protein
MQVPLIQIDAFADALFEGNPAAVVPLPAWPPDRLLQQVAEENNLSETAFLVADLPAAATPPPVDGAPAYHLRWFTPAVEVDLCGHATLASASYLLDDVHPDAGALQLWTRSGWLTVRRADDGAFTMDFPSPPLIPEPTDPALTRALGVPVLETFRGADVVCLLADVDAVRTVRPDLAALADVDARGVVVTAPGGDTGYAFVSRFFAPRSGIAEDPVTGSAHSQIAPLWAERLGRTELVARQLSARGGTVHCRVDGDRTHLTGRCRRYLTGRIELPD